MRLSPALVAGGTALDSREHWHVVTEADAALTRHHCNRFGFTLCEFFGACRRLLRSLSCTYGVQLCSPLPLLRRCHRLLCLHALLPLRRSFRLRPRPLLPLPVSDLLELLSAGRRLLGSALGLGLG